ncbi:MAG: hypothetical protein ABI972_24880 [Acidobacteriota bacterium]
MTQRHWTNDELLDHLYGVGPEDGHAKNCAECQERIAGLQTQRAGRTEDRWVPEEFLRAQREAISGRVARNVAREQTWWRPPAWAAVMVAVAMALSWPQMSREKLTAGSNATASDAGMYLEIYQTISTEEPRALAPMHSLFEDEE